MWRDTIFVEQRLWRHATVWPGKYFLIDVDPCSRHPTLE